MSAPAATLTALPLETRREGGWTSLILPAGAGEGVGALGTPGLWRRSGREGDPLVVFDLPPLVGESQRGAWIDWAVATAAGRLPEGWTSPDRATLTECGLRPERLVARSDASTSLGELSVEEHRLALGFSLGTIPDDLPRTRRAWLAALVEDARSHWRLVRLESDRRRVRAELDLSGAPHAALPSLLPYALDALRQVVEWCLPPLRLVLDSSIPSRVLSRPLERRRAAERTEA